MGTCPLEAVPATREAYDAHCAPTIHALRRRLPAAAIVDAWQQLVKAPPLASLVFGRARPGLDARVPPSVPVRPRSPPPRTLVIPRPVGFLEAIFRSAEASQAAAVRSTIRCGPCPNPLGFSPFFQQARLCKRQFEELRAGQRGREA